MKFYNLLPLFLIVLAVGGCTQQPPASSGTPPSVDRGIPPSDSTPIGEVKEFTITAKQWDFTPGTITVNQGDTVLLHIKSIDVTHGIGIPAFGINERLEPGQTVDIEFVADKTGTFRFACNVFCGSGHSTMDGQLIVK